MISWSRGRSTLVILISSRAIKQEVGYYLHREGPNLGKNIVSLVSCYHPALTQSSGPPTRDPPVLTPTLVLSLRVPLCRRRQARWLLRSSMAMQIFKISYHCNRLYVTLTLSSVYINRRVVVRRQSTPYTTIIP